MARRPFIAGNWKLNLGPPEAERLAGSLRAHLGGVSEVDLAVFPTTLSLLPVLARLEGSRIEVGIQDAHPAPSGAFTGANSPAMARAAGCTRLLVGHSERRQVFGETDDQTRAKVQAAFEHALLPILCVGETLAQREAGEVEAVVHGQLAAGLEGLSSDQVAAVTVAYEPVWAIGTGHTATPEQAQEVHASLRAWIRAHHPAYVAEELRLQYGGSVKPANAAHLLACPDIDGALVGGASLDADAFAAIVASVG